jgi:hypothetical protein
MSEMRAKLVEDWNTTTRGYLSYEEGVDLVLK